jgi:hypothetical protein
MGLCLIPGIKKHNLFIILLVLLYMAGVKNHPRNQSQYITHNWCSHCGVWLENKPLTCPECNRVTRKIMKATKINEVFRY